MLGWAGCGDQSPRFCRFSLKKLIQKKNCCFVCCLTQLQFHFISISNSSVKIPILPTMNDCKGNALPPRSTLEQSTLLISNPPEFHYNLPDDNADFYHFPNGNNRAQICQ